jgi:hypothetical protein
MKAHSSQKMKIQGCFSVKINTTDTMDTKVYLITFESFVTFVLVLTHRYFKDSICHK